MAQIFMQGGMMMWPLVVIVLVLVGLAVSTAVELFGRGARDPGRIQNGLDGMLFWGGLAVIIGILGTMAGYHRAITVVTAHGVVNPRAVWIGMAEGLVSTIAGLLVMAVAGLAWYLLRWRFIATSQTR